MPTYDFKHNETDEIWSDSIDFEDKDAYLKEHNCRIVFLSTPQVIGTSKDIYSRTSDDFKSRMKAIKGSYPSKGPNKATMENW